VVLGECTSSIDSAGRAGKSAAIDTCGVTRVLQGCYKGVTRGGARVVKGCHKDVTRMSQGCHKGVLRLLQE
jgi:hypothetical protein